MTAVMICGGRRDGEILEVPGYIEPDSRIVRFRMRPPFDPYGPSIDLDDELPFKIVDLNIVPRKSSSGPAWKIDLPKELW